MTLSAFDNIYESMLTYFGINWIVWVAIGLFVLAVFFATLRLPILVIMPVMALPVFLLTFYGIITSGYIVTVIVLALGVLLAIGLTRIFIR
jgi:hypothetical protein